MKAKYISLLFIIFSSNTYAYDAFKICKQKIIASKPYGKNAVINKPKDIQEYNNEVILVWHGMGDLIIRRKNGSSPLAAGRCIYDTKLSKITFLIIYPDVLISKYPDEINTLKTANKSKAHLIAKNLGLNQGEIEWIKRNGKKNITAAILKSKDPKKIIIGIENHDEKILKNLDKLQIINYYPDKHNHIYFGLFATDISKILAEKL